MINLQKEGITVMLREFGETENNENDIFIDEYEEDLFIDEEDLFIDEEDRFIDGEDRFIDEKDLYMNCHSILCSYVKALRPEIIAMILEKHSDIDKYVKYVEGLYEKKELIREIFERLSLSGEFTWKEQKVIMLKFGLIDGIPKTLAEVAEIMGCREDLIKMMINKCLFPMAIAKRHHEARIKFFEEVLSSGENSTPELCSESDEDK